MKPKLSGNVDLRLNRLNLRKIERIVKAIKFSKHLPIEDRVRKTKEAMGKLGLKPLDDDLVTHFLELRHSMFTFKPDPMASK